MGGTARGLVDEVELLLLAGKQARAAEVAMDAWELANDLKLPMQSFSLARTEVTLMADRFLDANALMMAADDEMSSRERWDFDCLRGIISLRLGEVAPDYFDKALQQCELWLSRSEMNREAAATQVLALFGKVVCGEDAYLGLAVERYKSLSGPRIGAKTMMNLTRRLELLRLASKSASLEKIFVSLPQSSFRQ